MRALIIALSVLSMASPAVGQQVTVCDLLKTALAGNPVINAPSPKAAPATMAWPSGSTSVGGGSYSVLLFDGKPGAVDVSKMQQAIATADRQVGQCLPTAKRTIAPMGANDKEIRYCLAGSARGVSIVSSQGSKAISAYLTVEASRTKVCQ